MDYCAYSRTIIARASTFFNNFFSHSFRSIHIVNISGRRLKNILRLFRGRFSRHKRPAKSNMSPTTDQVYKATKKWKKKIGRRCGQDAPGWVMGHLVGSCFIFFGPFKNRLPPPPPPPPISIQLCFFFFALLLCFSTNRRNQNVSY